MSQPLPPPGWYPDPAGSGRQRYFDGTTWTNSFAPLHQPGPYVPPRPAKSSATRTALMVIGGVFVLLFGGCVALIAVGAKDDSGTGGLTGRSSAGVGSSVSDGQFSFVVNGVTWSPPSMVDKLDDPRGEWVVLKVSVTNTGDRPQTFFPQNQKLIDTQGREYEPDSMEAYSINDDVMTDLNPGFTASFNVPFDIPPGTELAEVELHDSAFSGGVSVSLAS